MSILIAFPHEETCTHEEMLAQILSSAHALNIKISTAESCTGGALARELTRLPGSSEVFLGGVVSYATELKKTILKVDAEILDDVAQGPVSRLSAEQMARGVCELTQSDLALSTTGFAGPGSVDRYHEVGGVWLGFARHDTVEPSIIHTSAHYIHFKGNRDSIVKQAVSAALMWLAAQLHFEETMQKQ